LFYKPVEIRINEDSPVPVQYQVSKKVLDARREYPFDMTALAVDESGTQLFSDVISVEAGDPGIIRVSFNARLVTELGSLLDITLKSKKFANLVTQIWMDTALLVRSGQVRGLPEEAAREFCLRMILPDRLPLRLEKKSDLKKRLKRSPDHADALALCCYAAIRNGLAVGSTREHPAGGSMFPLRRPSLRSVDYEEPDFSDFTLD
jgi:hypothetical protein